MGATYDLIAKETGEQQGQPTDIEDFATALVRFENGATLDIEASWASHIKEWELMETRILGTKAGLMQRNTNEGYEFGAELYLERDGCHVDLQPHSMGAFAVKPSSMVPGVTGPVEHFVECMVNDKLHIATGEEGLVVTRILDAIYESADKKEPIEID